MDISAIIRARERRGELIRRLILLTLGTLVAGVGTWFAGVDAWHSTAIGFAAAAAGLTWILVPRADQHGWLATRGDSTDGARSEVARLSWTLLIHKDQVRDSVADRVYRQAAARLARRQFELDDPGDADAIGAVIGEGVYSSLVASRSRPISFPSLMNCISALERWDANETSALRPPGAPAARSPQKERAR